MFLDKYILGSWVCRTCINSFIAIRSKLDMCFFFWIFLNFYYSHRLNHIGNEYDARAQPSHFCEKKFFFWECTNFFFLLCSFVSPYIWFNSLLRLLSRLVWWDLFVLVSKCTSSKNSSIWHSVSVIFFKHSCQRKLIPSYNRLFVCRIDNVSNVQM